MEEEEEHCPSEFYYPEDLETFDVETETGITECHMINNLLTQLARAVLRNITSFGPYCHDLGPIFPSTALTLG